MTRDKKILYLISVFAFVFLFAAMFIPIDNGRWITVAILFAICALSFFLIKRRKAISFNSRQILLIMAVMGALYILLYYLTGIPFGFYSSSVNKFGTRFINYVLPIAIIIVLSEYFRNVLLMQDDKIADLSSYLSCVIVEVLIFANLRRITTFNIFLDLVGLNLLPAIITNLLFNYLSRRYGTLPNIAYRLIISLIPYCIPYVPGLPESLYAFAKIVIPLIIYVFIDALYERKRRRALKSKTAKVISYVCIGIGVLFSLSLIMLVSGKFRYGAIVVATESMTGELNVGDAVVYEDYDDQEIELGQIIVFNSGSSKIIHRVVDVKNIDGQTRYYTKGDANDDIDAGFVTETQIVGLCHFKIPGIGYPSIWIRQIFSN